MSINQQLTDYISFFITEKGIRDVFQLSGGMIAQIIDKIARNSQTKVHSLFHEQSCAFAVSAYGRIHKTPSIAFATSGPGATNLLTGIGDCYFDSVPAIFITGQVNTHELKGGRAVRQLGFQETDIVSMAKPVTKYAVQLDEYSDFIEIFERAYQIAVSGRPGPVLLDIPMNVQRANITTGIFLEPDSYSWPEIDINEVVSAISVAKKPIIWAGNGIHTGSAENLFGRFVELTKIPFVTSLHAIDILPESVYKTGMIGSYGNRWANLCVKECDLILFLGTRIDIRQTGANLSIFKNKKLIHVDIEEGEMNNRLNVDISIHSGVHNFLAKFIDECNQHFDFSDWLHDIENFRLAHPVVKELSVGKTEINPHNFFKLLSETSPGNRIYTVDVGSHQMWCAQSLKFQSGDRFLTSGGMGAMGFSLPAAIGAAVSTDNQVVVIAGDGSFQINLQELQYISKNNLNIKIIIVNNNSLGMIRQFQDSYLEGRYFGTKWGYSTPDFCAVSEAYGIPSRIIRSQDEISSALDWLCAGNTPKFLEVEISSGINVYPKIAFGQTMDKMEPDFKPRDMEGT